MKLEKIRKVHEGRFLHLYELDYTNNAGRKKVYEMASRRHIDGPEQLGAKSDGITLIGLSGDKLLLLKEFRMAINSYVYNLCAGMPEPGETTEECTARELMEETGLKLKRIIDILPPAYGAVGISDVMTTLVVAELEGTPGGSDDENEDIKAGFYTRDEVAQLLKKEKFTSRCQQIAWCFARGMEF